jgi:hypothetical protein
VITLKQLESKAIPPAILRGEGSPMSVPPRGESDRRRSMKGHGAKLPRKQEAAIAALLSHRNTEEAAQSIGVSPHTLRRWLEIPDFKEAYLQARRNAVSQAYARLQQNSGAASALLMKLLADPATKASTRVQAARSILEFASKALETEDMLLRIARLEKSDQKRGPV